MTLMAKGSRRACNKAWYSLLPSIWPWWLEVYVAVVAVVAVRRTLHGVCAAVEG